MPREDTVDFVTAFAVGTVLGVGAALLLQPSRPTARDRVVKQLKPYRKQMKRSYSQVRDGLRSGRGATSELSGEIVDAGRELLDDFRSEIGEILDEARDEIREIVGSQRRDLAKGARRARRKMGI